MYGYKQTSDKKDNKTEKTIHMYVRKYVKAAVSKPQFVTDNKAK